MKKIYEEDLTIHKNASIQNLCYNSEFHTNSNHQVTIPKKT